MKNMEWHGDSVIRSAKNALPKAVTEACVILQGAAKLLAPYKSGNLRNSITYTVSGEEGKVGTNVDYGPAQEFGTYKMAAQPYLRPAADSNRTRIEKQLGLAIGQAAEAGGKR